MAVVVGGGVGGGGVVARAAFVEISKNLTATPRFKPTASGVTTYSCGCHVRVGELTFRTVVRTDQLSL